MADPWWAWDTDDDDSWLSEFSGEDVRALVRERNRLLAAVSPDNAEAVAAWAGWLGEAQSDENQRTTLPAWDRRLAAALLRARAEAERP